MFCPNCRAEYKEGITLCADCNVELVHELLPEDIAEYVDLVDLETYPDRNEAELAKGVLSGSGIEAVIYGDEYGGYAPALSFSEGVKLMVKKKDIVRARLVLMEVEETPDDV